MSKKKPRDIKTHPILVQEHPVPAQTTRVSAMRVPVSMPPRIRVYTASKLSEGPLWRSFARAWSQHVEFVARWPFMHVNTSGDPGWPDDCPAHAAEFWKHDAEDVAKADVVLVYCQGGGTGSSLQDIDHLRGALVEVGMGLALGKTIIVIGSHPSYSTWQFHERVRRVKTFDDAYSLLRLMGGRPGAGTQEDDEGDSDDANTKSYARGKPSANTKSSASGKPKTADSLLRKIVRNAHEFSDKKHREASARWATENLTPDKDKDYDL